MAGKFCLEVLAQEVRDHFTHYELPSIQPFRPFLFFSAFVKNNKGLSGFPYLLGRQSTQRLI